MRNKVISYLLFVLIVIGLISLYSFSVKRNTLKPIGNTEVEFREGDNYFLTHNMVNKLLVQNGTNVLNQTKSSIDLYGLEKLVLRNPFVKEATVYLTPRGVLKTFIKQREPIARLLDKNGSFYIDETLVQFPMSSNFSTRTILVSNVKKEEDIEKIKELVLYVKQDDFLDKEIVGIEKKSNDFILRVRSGDYKVNIGDVVDVDNKFRKLKAFYLKAFSDKTIGKYKVINLKYHNQVVCEK